MSADENVKTQDEAANASRSRPLKVGLILPDTEREMGGETARWSDLVADGQDGRRSRL